MTEQFANFAQSSLARACGTNDAVIFVANASTFPLLGNFRIVVQMFDASGLNPISHPELMIVTAVGGNGTFIVTRGAENTTPIAFRSGARVTHIITAGVMQALSAGGGGGGGNYREVDATVVNMTAADGTVEISQLIPAPVTVYLDPTGMSINQRQILMDGAGVAGTYPITIVPLGGANINGAPNLTIFEDWGARSWFYNGANFRAFL